MTQNSYETISTVILHLDLKITGSGEELNGVDGEEYNDFVEIAKYAEIPDVQMIGNFHAREWMSYEVPMMFLETIAHYYGMAGIDNDGDGLVDEDARIDDSVETVNSMMMAAAFRWHQIFKIPMEMESLVAW